MKCLLALLTLITVASTACGPTDNYAAKVNGAEISTETILDELHTVTSNPRYLAVLNEQLGGTTSGSGIQPAGSNTVNSNYTAQVVFNRILVSLIDSAAARENVTPTTDQSAQAEQAVRSDLGDDSLFNSLPEGYRSYLINRQAKLSALMAARNTLEAQRKYYDENKDKYTQYCVRHILVDSETQAKQLRAEIAGGGDFAAVAKQYSTDSSAQGGSAAQGGALGCFSGEQLEQFIEPFRDAVLALEVNRLSEPVQTRFGYHLIEVTAKTPQAFEQVQSQISNQLTSATAFFDDQLRDAKVTVNPRFGVYRAGDAAQGTSPSVNPPTANAVSPKAPSASGATPDIQQIPAQ